MSEVIWLTGCASGVGQHLAKILVAQNHRVVATDLHIAPIEALARAEGWPDSVLIRKLDVTSRNDWASVFNEVMEKWGKVDKLLNVAGYIHPGYVHETEEHQVDRHLDINVKGVMYGSQLMARHMVRQGYGHIVNIASLAALAPIPGIALYSASKYAVRAFSLALAEELRPLGVHVTVVCPDAIQTPMLALQEDFEEAALTFSGDRVLSVQDIERVVLDDVFGKKPLEVVLPWHRGLLAKLNNHFPWVSSWIAGSLKKKGQRAQARLKGLRS